MQPQNSEHVTTPEIAPPTPPVAAERIPVLPSPEAGIETGAERREQTAEAQAAASDAAQAAGVVAPVPVVATPAQPQDATGHPLTAADEDVIEKEWVDKAKQIILETKDDPHARTERVNHLQRDYLKKRYGKDLGVSS